MSSDLLKQLSIQQDELVRTDQLLHSQQAKQEELTNEMLEFSKDLICQLHLLSLVRSHIINPKNLTVKEIVDSQAFSGLKFAKLEYCPSFIDPNRLNHYMFFTAYLRRHPQTLARIFYDYCRAVPQNRYACAYSLFLTLFQQGWCIEEDELLSQTLQYMADIQFNSTEAPPNTIDPNPPRKLKIPLSSPDVAICNYQPFITFATAYLFNGASFSFLQSALSPIIIKLHSLSQLYDMRSIFEVNPENFGVAPVKYWAEIVKYANQVYKSMILCLELLPPGVFALMNHLKKLKVNLNLVFFESFVNRALDSPAVLGLLPWHPGHSDWKPSKDIADVFRTKYADVLRNGTSVSLRGLLKSMPEYDEIDLDALYSILAEPSKFGSLMISETELLSTNPSFPKEVLITGSDVILLHKAALHLSKDFEDPELSKILGRIGEPLDEKPAAAEHFRIVITRQKEMTAAAKRIQTVSLFSGNVIDATKHSDPYAEQFCDIIANLPAFENVIRATNPANVEDFLARLRMIAPLFLKKTQILQADSVFDYALHNISDPSGLIERVRAVQESRALWGLRATDRTSSLRSQHQHIASSKSTVAEIRQNVQSHLLLEIADLLVNGEMCQDYREAMLKGHMFIQDHETFQGKAAEIIKGARRLLKEYNIDENRASSISRILFFKLTDHVIFQRYAISDKINWKQSIIITKELEKHAAEIAGEIQSSKNHYLERAADMLGHIRSNSSVSVIFHYAVEVARIIKTLCDNSPELDFDRCLLWVVATTKAKHVLIIARFIQHFMTSEATIASLFTENELSLLAVIPRGSKLLVDACANYYPKIREWNI